MKQYPFDQRLHLILVGTFIFVPLSLVIWHGWIDLGRRRFEDGDGFKLIVIGFILFCVAGWSAWLVQRIYVMRGGRLPTRRDDPVARDYDDDEFRDWPDDRASHSNNS